MFLVQYGVSDLITEVKTEVLASGAPLPSAAWFNLMRYGIYGTV